MCKIEKDENTNLETFQCPNGSATVLSTDRHLKYSKYTDKEYNIHYFQFRIEENY